MEDPCFQGCYITETTTSRFISWVFDNKVPFTLLFYLLDSGQDQIINFALEETIEEFRGIKATLLVDNIA